MKLLILGGTGFVGSNLCQELNKKNITHISKSRSNGFNLKDLEQTRECFSSIKPDIIVNCAAHVGSLNYVTEQAAEVLSDNSRMILNLYEAIAKESPKSLVINPIANCAYPGNAKSYIEDHWLDGVPHHSVLAYGMTRRLLWTTSESYAMEYNIRSVNFLVPNMYGPNDSTDPNKAHALNALISKFIKAKKLKKNSIDIWGTGIAIREWLYVKDFAGIIIHLIQNPNMVGLSEPLNIAQNFGLSVRELVTIIKDNINYSGEINWDHTKPDGAPKKVMDDRRFRKVFPNFEFTTLDVGIQSTVEYYSSIYPY